jgi:protease-4
LQVIAFMDRGEYDMEAVKAAGFVTGLVYECELEEMLRKRTGGKEDQLPTVGYSKYKKVRPSTFGINAGGKKAVAVVRTSGAIIGGSGGTGATITAADVIRQLRGIKKNKAIAAVVLRIDSPGGDALASDLMWREIQELAKVGWWCGCVGGGGDGVRVWKGDLVWLKSMEVQVRRGVEPISSL